MDSLSGTQGLDRLQASSTTFLPSDEPISNSQMSLADQLAAADGLSRTEATQTSSSDSISRVPPTRRTSDSRSSDKPSHDSRFEQTLENRVVASGTTTPASRTSIDATSDLFHGITLKGNDAENSQGEGNSVETVSAPLSTTMSSSLSDIQTFKSRMPANLALRSTVNGTRDLPSPSHGSPLRQSMIFKQEQLSQLHLADDRCGNKQASVSPSEGGSTIPRSISLPVTSVKDLPLPPTPSRYADADESAILGVKASESPVELPHQNVKGLSSDVSDSSRLANMASPRRADYVIAVVGASQVGKSTIIGKAFKAWGLSAPVSLNAEDAPSAYKINRYTAAVDTGQPPRKRIVEIHEVDLLALRPLDAPSAMLSSWPEVLPKIDGVMVCYDATNEGSVTGLPEIVRDLCYQLPAMVIACKTDPGIEAELAIKPFEGNEIGAPYGIGLVELSVLSQQGRHKMRMGFGWMLKAISKQRRNRLPKEKRRPSSATSPTDHAGTAEQRVLTSEREALGPDPTSLLDHRISIADGHASRLSMNRSVSDGALDAMADAGMSANPGTPNEIGSTATTHSVASKPKRTSSVASRFVSLQDLLDRLINAIIGGIDNAFVNTFFLSYRRFCEPPQVISFLLERWNNLLGNTRMAKQYLLWSQMRMVITMAEWLEAYPGDFSSQEARRLIAKFYASASQRTHLAHVAAEIAIALQKLHESNDLDESWSVSTQRKTSPEGHNPPVPVNSPGKTTEDSADDRDNFDIRSTYSGLDETTLEAIRASDTLESLRSMSPAAPSGDLTSQLPSSHTNSRRQSTGSKLSLLSSGITVPNGHSDNGHTMSRTSTMATNRFLFRVDTDASRQTRASTDGSRSISEIESLEGKVFQKPLALFYELSDLAIAVELCREEWQLFSTIRPRDCFRQVLGGEKETPASVSAQHFNTISSWVSTLVLGPAKPKYRAQVYEKFCAVVTQLIKLRNYSSTWAVASGLNDFSVRRLGVTLSLVKPGYKRELQDALQLIDSTGSYKLYREALKKDCDLGSKAIPFLGVITQDLTKIHAAHFQDQDTEERIHWSKYSVMAEAIAPLALYQARGDIVAGLAQSGGARYLLADTPLLDEEGLYQRSKHIEPDPRPGTSGAQNSASTTGVRLKRLMAESVFGNGLTP